MEEDNEFFDEIVDAIAMYNRIIVSAQTALDILQDENSSEDALVIDVFEYGAKAIVKRLAKDVDVQSILDGNT